MEIYVLFAFCWKLKYDTDTDPASRTINMMALVKNKFNSILILRVGDSSRWHTTCSASEKARIIHTHTHTGTRRVAHDNTIHFPWLCFIQDDDNDDDGDEGNDATAIHLFHFA